MEGKTNNVSRLITAYYLFGKKNMNCDYRIAGPDDISLLIDLRVEFVKDMHPEFSDEKLKSIKSGTAAYIQKFVRDGKYVGFIGSVGSEIACTGALLIYSLPPLQTECERKIGHALNIFTKKEHRRKGYGRGLMEYIKEYAKREGFHRIFLNATKDGAPLYEVCGFVDSEKAMEYNFTK